MYLVIHPLKGGSLFVEDHHFMDVKDDKCTCYLTY